MEEHCIGLINEKCSVRRPFESKELLQQYCYCWRACGTHDGQEKYIHFFSCGNVNYNVHLEGPGLYVIIILIFSLTKQDWRMRTIIDLDQGRDQ